MRILYFCLAVDTEDPILGFTAGWIRELAERVEFVHVITMRVGRAEVPGNVRIYSVGKERGYSEPRRAFEFYQILMNVLRKDHVDICFAHMMPLFTVLGGPVLKAKRIPIVTWYAHPSLTWILRLAHHLSRQMLASVTTAYPYKRDKLIAIGQGIDTKLFSPDAAVPPDEPPVVLCVGRLSPVKDHPTLLQAASLLRQTWNRPFRIVLVGGPGAPRDESHVRSLHEQMSELGLENIVHFEPAVSMEKLPLWYRRCAVYVNLTPTGSGDKVAWEAMSCGKLCVAANDGFRETLGKYAALLLFPHGDAESLAARLHWALSLSEGERQRVELYLREQVVNGHSLNGLATKLVDLFARLVEKQSGPRGLTRETI
ncbi:MAG: glycosyltransferase family 4 protein [Candidatus Binatia bacterium]